MLASLQALESAGRMYDSSTASGLSSNYEKLFNQYMEVVSQLATGLDAVAEEEARQAKLKSEAEAAAEAKRREELAAKKAQELADADNATKITLYTEEINGYQTRINEIFALGNARRLDFEADFLRDYGQVIESVYDPATDSWTEGQFVEEYKAAEEAYY